MSLILDKLTPSAAPPRVSRGRLLDALNESMERCTSTVIHGRTGAGKTLLAADFARRRNERRVVWYKVDAPEVDLPQFLKYLIAAMRQQHPGFGRKTLALLAESDAALPEEVASHLAESFIYEMTMLEADEPVLLVIDDLHLLYDAAWVIPFFTRLLPLLPPEAHIILIGRTLPPAPLWRMRSKQTLRVIDEAALAFTLAEAEALFESYGLPLKPAAQALAETWGRAAALDAHARALQETRDDAATRRDAADTSHAAQARVRAGTRGSNGGNGGGGGARGSQLQLVKGYGTKPSAGVR